MGISDGDERCAMSGRWLSAWGRLGVGRRVKTENPQPGTTPRPYHTVAMLLSWSLLFRVVVLLALAAHVFLQYGLARTLEPADGLNAGSVIKAAAFSLAMLVPLCWAAALPDLPAIYRHGRRHHRWAHGRCPACDYQVQAGGGVGCPECGTPMSEPPPYLFTWATVRRFVVLAFVAWVIGCAVAETWVVAGGTQWIATTA